MSECTSAAAKTPFTGGVLPMFYRKLVALDPALHLGWGVRGQYSVAVAARANALPLGVSEFAAASAHYPVVFSPAGQTAFPVIITTLVQGERNLFVDTQGRWRKEAYFPGWLRRYPFWLQPDADGRSASVWLDPSSDRVVPLQDDASAQPLFDFRGQANEALQKIVSFCGLCLDDSMRTSAFMQALEEHQLLAMRQARIEISPGRHYGLSGFRVVDMDAYRRLPDAVLAHWARNGWADLVGLHQLSMQTGWSRLLELRRAQSDAEMDATATAGA